MRKDLGEELRRCILRIVREEQDRIKPSILKPHRAIRKGWVARLGPGQIKGLIDLPGENWDIKWPYKASIKFDDSLISPTSLWRYAGGL